MRSFSYNPVCVFFLSTYSNTRASCFLMNLLLVNYIFILTGQSTHVLLSMLIKHLDHKNILKRPNMQLDVVAVTTALAQDAKVEPSIAIIGAVSDCMRHLRKSIQCSLDDANLGDDVKSWNKSLSEAVDQCLVQLIHKVMRMLFYF